MAAGKLSDRVRNAAAVNLRFSADLLNLARQYLQAFGAALTQPQAADEAPAGEARPTLLLAGRADETANASFALSGSSNLKGTFSLEVAGEFEDSKVRVEPDQICFEEDGDKIVRILAKIGPKTQPDTNYSGSVLIPELNHEITGFVLRRLAK